MKRCKKCGVIKPLDEFYKELKMEDGHRNICKKCINVRSRKWEKENIEKRKKYYQKNKKLIKEKSKKYRKDNIEHYKAYSKEYYKENKKRLYELGLKWRENNPEKVKAINTKWRKNNKDKIKKICKKFYEKKKKDKKWCEKCAVASRNSRLKKYYNINLYDYNILLKKQQYKCAICGKHQNNFKKNFAIDHCHKTGKIRGLLCANCNLGLGSLEDNKQTLKNAITYLFNSEKFNIIKKQDKLRI